MVLQGEVSQQGRSLPFLLPTLPKGTLGIRNVHTKNVVGTLSTSSPGSVVCNMIAQRVTLIEGVTCARYVCKRPNRSDVAQKNVFMCLICYSRYPCRVKGR